MLISITAVKDGRYYFSAEIFRYTSDDSLSMTSFNRGCIIGIVLGCSLYAFFILFYKQINTESLQHLKQDVRASIDHNLEKFHLRNHMQETDATTSALDSSIPQPHSTNAMQIGQPPSDSMPDHEISTSHVPPSLKEFFQNVISPKHHEKEVLAEPTTKPEIDQQQQEQEEERSDDHKQCRLYLEKYAVIPGSSWGTLPTELQKSWNSLNCDELIKHDTAKLAKVLEKEISKTSATAIALEENKKKSKRKKKGKDLAPGIVGMDKDNKAWCHEIKERYGVVPLRSWGALPMNYLDSWKGRRCDLVFTTERMASRPLSVCPDLSSTVIGGTAEKKSESKKPEHSNLREDLPLIAVMAATTTRKVSKPSTKNLSLFMYLLPSLVRTLDCGYRYEYVLGYDKGDPFYDSKEGMAEVLAWFKNNVENPMRKNGINIKLRLVKVNNTIKKPGPVFLEMARAAYNNNADYFYRINDDTELISYWAEKYVKGLSTLSTPYGVIGPLCNQGNEKILTHDFTNRVHMDIFEMNYYPPELTDWWMDDWISLVYGKMRTFKAKSVHVMHHTGTHGTRYAVDQSNKNRLLSLIIEGRIKIRQYMLTHNVPESDIKAFDLDQYQGFIHSDIPKMNH